ncbi:MAG: Holliday junction branch migration DNA helicase RuvB [Patescibacteria group bacterium]
MINSSLKSEKKSKKEPKKSLVIEEKQILNQIEESEKALRPKGLIDYVGQTNLKKQLHLILESCKLRKSMPEHMLFYGPAGLGKTTISSIVANELNVTFKAITASSLQKVGDIVALLSNLDERTILFIDEIHRLKAPLEESLYSAMEDQKIDILIGKGNGATTLRIDLPEITIIGATTLAGKLSKPLRDRFPSIFQLELYSMEEMKQLIVSNSVKIGLKIEPEVLDLIASRSRGTPRIANNIIKRFLDLQLVNEYKTLSVDEVEGFFNVIGVYQEGLTKSDLKYLKSLQESQLSLKTLSGVLMEETDTIEQVIEPYLLYLGLVDKDSNGRRLTPKGSDLLTKVYL